MSSVPLTLQQLATKSAVIESLGCPEVMAKRLKSMGVFVGQQIEVSRRGNPLIVKAAGSRIAISADLAQQITVTESANG